MSKHDEILEIERLQARAIAEIDKSPMDVVSHNVLRHAATMLHYLRKLAACASVPDDASIAVLAIGPFEDAPSGRRRVASAVEDVAVRALRVIESSPRMEPQAKRVMLDVVRHVQHLQRLIRRSDAPSTRDVMAVFHSPHVFDIDTQLGSAVAAMHVEQIARTEKIATALDPVVFNRDARRQLRFK